MIRAIEVYDSFEPKRLLEVRFVYGAKENPSAHVDLNEIGERRFGNTETGKTFRVCYASLRDLIIPEESQSRKPYKNKRNRKL